MTETMNMFPVVKLLKYVTEAVLFSIVAFNKSYTDISQGSVVTHVSCGGIFSESIMTNFLLILTVKKF